MSAQSPANWRSAQLLLVSLSCLIVFAFPYGYHIDLGPGPNILMAIIWEFPRGRELRFFTALEYFPCFLYRLVALWAIWRFLAGRFEREKVLVHTGLAELLPCLLSVPGAVFLNQEGENFLPIMIPIPLLWFFALLLRTPPRERIPVAGE